MAGSVVVASHYGNHPIVDPFIRHHSALGIQDFVFLDLSQDGGLATHLHGRRGCTVWRPLDMGQPEPVVLWLKWAPKPVRRRAMVFVARYV